MEVQVLDKAVLGTLVEANDALIIAGKGHEDYQILGTEKVHFDDAEEARFAIERRRGGLRVASCE